MQIVEESMTLLKQKHEEMQRKFDNAVVARKEFLEKFDPVSHTLTEV